MKREPALRGASGHFAAVRSRKKRCLGSCALVLLLLGALALAVFLVARGGASSLRWQLALLGQAEALNRPAGADDTPVRVLLRPGQSATSLARELAAADLIHSEQLFLAHLRAEGLDRRLVAGEYYLDSTRSIVAVAAALGALGSSPFPYPALVAQDAGPRIRFTVAAGETTAAIGQRLLAAGVIDDATFFERYVARNGLAAAIEPAIYFFSPAQHVGEIAHRLTNAAASVIPLQITPGMRLEEIAQALDESAHPFAFRGADFLYLVGQGAAVPPEFRALTQLPIGASLEGFFLPQFQRLTPDISAQELRDLLLEAFPNALAETTLAQEAAAQGWTIYEAVTLAAIVEREALFAEEFAAIAGVYRNRLAQRWRLEADPTVQYALQGTRGRWWPQISPADYSNVVSPYNTYLQAGLPPGPIASPSLAAIEAALRPEQSDYFFFRARCDGSGTHAFAVTYEEHLANGC